MEGQWQGCRVLLEIKAADTAYPTKKLSTEDPIPRTTAYCWAIVRAMKNSLMDDIHVQFYFLSTLFRNDKTPIPDNTILSL